MFTKTIPNPIVENIFAEIKTYNEKSDNVHSIEFVHSSSSALFSFIGKEVTVHKKMATYLIKLFLML